jgi:hypothetical protein
MVKMIIEGKEWDVPSSKYNIYSDKTYEEGQTFYNSIEWTIVREQFLNDKQELKCVYCSMDLSGENKRFLNVDHIKPVRKNWNLRLEFSNLQITCCNCNKSKGNEDMPDLSITSKEYQKAYRQQVTMEYEHNKLQEKLWRKRRIEKWLNKQKNK